MAISGGDGSIVLTTNVDQSGLKKGLGSMKKLGATAGKAFLAIGAAAATATVAITKMATDAYADYEQLVGGVETLFKGSADKVLAYAENAFFTAGVSANEYMQQVTSFSASLLSSLSGDTDKAADIANMALIDISDNVNKMGSSMESVTLAYQGFAKQQYMLLDNLKLGYGGTKTEMERLLKDAQALTGVKYDINNLADVYSAIHAIQEQLGITGTTAKEAEKTITGSANMMKAAWQNVLSAIAGGGDLGKAINNLVYSVQKYFENIVPVIERSLQGIGQLIERVAPMLVQTVARALIKAIPSLLNAVYQMIIGLAKGIYQGIIDLFKGGTQKVLKAQTNEIAQSVDNQNDLTEAIEETTKAAKGQLAAYDEINTISRDTAETAGNVGGSQPVKTSEIIDTAATETSIDNLANKIKNTFAPVGEYLKNTFGNAFESIRVTASNEWERIKKSASLIGKDFAENIAPKIKETFTNDIVPIVADSIQYISEDWDTILDIAHRTFDKVYDEVISPFVQRFTNIWGDMWDTTKEVWDERSGDIHEGFQNFLTGVGDLWNTFYESIIKPVFDRIGEVIDWLWENHLKDLWLNIQDFIASATEFLLALWNNVLKPIVGYIIEYVGPIISDVVGAIGDDIGKVIGFIADILKDLIRRCKGLLDFLTGVFTGDWEKAWNGIKDFVEGTWDMIWGIIKGVINLIIDGLNTLWRNIYRVFSGIANGIGKAVGWIGSLMGKDWEFKMPENPPLIPKLARGAVLPANKPFLAQLGDQKNGRNLEAPESLLREIYAEGNAETNALLQQLIQVMQMGMTVNVDGQQLMRINRDAETRSGRQTVTGGFANAY